MAKFLRSKNALIITVLFLLLFSTLSVFIFKFNLGPFFYDSTVLFLELDENRDTDNVASEISNIWRFSSIEKEGDKKFYIFFQTLDEVSKGKITEALPNMFPNSISSNFFNYQPAREGMILTRSIIVFAIFLLISLSFYLTQLKGIGLTRKELIDLLLSEAVLFAFALFCLSGFIALVGGLGFVMDTSFFVFTLISILIIITSFLYYFFRFKDEGKRLSKYDPKVIEKNILANNWPEFVFLLSLCILLLFVPSLVISVNIALSSIQVIIAILLSAYTFFVLRKYMLEISIFDNKLLNKVSKSKWFIKKW